MANSVHKIDNGLSNIGFINDDTKETTGASQIPSTPQEEFRIPHDLIPSNLTTSLESGVVPHSRSLSSKERNTKVGHVPTDSEEDSHGTGSCGYFCCLPSFLQPLASGRLFVFFLCILSLTESGLTVGYISSMVTSFELQFRFSSTLTGFVVSCYDIGTLVVILTSYFGGRAAAHRPLWIAWSAWTMVLGSTIVALPHFFIAYEIHGNDTSQSLCHADEPAAFENVPETNICPPGDDSDIEGSALFFLIPGMLLIGAGSTATLTLGTTYIDDFVRKKEAPILLAMLYSTTVIGPALGFLVGSLFLKYYVDFDSVSMHAVDISPSNPRWVGAWWLGFFFFAGAILLMAIPIFAFPAKLKKTNGTLKELKDEDAEDGMNVRMAFSEVSLSKIPLAVWGLIKNPVYMMVNIASAAEFSIVTGFVRFAPKFLQSQFELSAGKASLLTGTLIPVGALGLITGGLILNRVSPGLRSTVNVLCASTILSGVLYGLIYIPGTCSNAMMAGVTAPYNCSDSHWHRPTNPQSAELQSSCNAQCSCDTSVYSPICTKTGLAYYNPCFAGCNIERRDPADNETFLYFNCTCVEEYNTSLCNIIPDASKSDHGAVYSQIVEPDATTGLCDTNCNLMIPFISLFLVLVFFSAAQQMPALMTLLRCVKKEERPFALGLQFVIIRLLGYIPSPIYYGAVIDSSCILWQKDCQLEDGACLMYDNEGFFYRYIGISTILKAVSLCMAVLVYAFVRQTHTRWAPIAKLPPPPMSEDSAVISDSTESPQDDKKISSSLGYGSTDEIPTITCRNSLQ